MIHEAGILNDHYFSLSIHPAIPTFKCLRTGIKRQTLGLGDPSGMYFFRMNECWNGRTDTMCETYVYLFGRDLVGQDITSPMETMSSTNLLLTVGLADWITYDSCLVFFMDSAFCVSQIIPLVTPFPQSLILKDCSVYSTRVEVT